MSRVEGALPTPPEAGAGRQRGSYRLLKTGPLPYSSGEPGGGRLATLTSAPRPAFPIMSECSWQ
jgi:hypothetical protein